MKTTKEVIRLDEYKPTPYEIPNVSLKFDLAPESTTVTAELKIQRREGTGENTPLILDGDELNLTQVLIDDDELKDGEFQASSYKLTIASPPEQPFKLKIVTNLSPERNTKFMGLFKSTGTYCTQCEAEGFRRITYFYDRPDVMSVYTVRIEADKSTCPVLLSNGNLVDQGDLEGNGRHFAVWQDPFPKPAYLFALVAGNLSRVSDQFKTASGRNVDLAIYVEHGNEHRCTYAMDALKRSMKWDEEAYGCEYDLDLFNIVAVSDFNMGAMENKGLNIFNDKYVLADPDSATDIDYANIESVIAHEYFHNWTGNRITCRDWFQLCLKEGLTVFRDQEFTADVRSRPVKRISDVQTLRSHQFPEDAGPLAHPVRPETYTEISNFYTATVYEKGAEVVRMLKTVLGEKGFQDGIRLYLKRHDGQAATIEQFLACFSDATGWNIEQFKLWYEQSGTPFVKSSGSWDEAGKSFRLELEQSINPTPGQDSKNPMVIPIKFGLVGPNGQDMDYEEVSGAEVHDDVIIMDKQSQSVTFTGISSKPVPSLFRHFSAPVKLIDETAVENSLFLVTHDNDSFNRWQSLQSLTLQHLVKTLNEARIGKLIYEEDGDLIEAFKTLIVSKDMDHDFKSLILQLPSELNIAQEIASNVDTDAVASARQSFRQTIAQRHWDVILAEYNALNSTAEYTPDAVSSGRRSLRNRYLDYLSKGNKLQGGEIAFEQFNASNNMTDRLAALMNLVHDEHSNAMEALDSFYERYKENNLAVNKWFTVQATAPGGKTLDRVIELTGHQSFTYSNPNRLRSLIDAFATVNQTGFNRKDGAGYEFVADNVLKIDSFNPQLAARILTSFNHWRSLEPLRRMQAEKALQRIAMQPFHSSDVSDIVSRMLAQ